MSNCLVTLRSPTYAMKAQMVLSRNGITVTPVKLGSGFSENGCTHGLRFDCRLKNDIIRLLHENRVPFSKVTQT